MPIATFRLPPTGEPAPAMLDAWREVGCLVFEGFAAERACEALLARAAAIVDAFDPTGAAAFSTRSHAHAAQAYFLDSGAAVRCFLEEDAVDPAGRPRLPKARSVNKIGHTLHDLDPVFSRFSRDRRLEPLVRALGVAEPLLLQSMLVCKPPRVGGEVVWHQDASFLRTEPDSVVGLWFALEDATRENGCLWVLPRAHRGPVRRRFVRRGDDVAFEDLDATPFDVARRVPIEAPRGTLVVLHGRLPHASEPNRSARSRQAYSLHVIDGCCAYPQDNWLRRGPGLPLRGFAT